MKTSGILFLEVGISDPKKMIDLMLDRSRFAKTGEFGFLDVSALNWFGALSYLINKKSKRKILNRLNNVLRLDEPYDLALRSLFKSGELKGLTIFPFVTTPSVHAKRSQLSEDKTRLTDETWIAFRNLMF